MRLRYLDHNAGTPLGPAARAAMAAMLDGGPGNPSSIHAAGRAARGRLELARRQVAALVGAEPEGVVFASGGTEAIALGVAGLARRARALDPARTRVLVGAAEHPAAIGAAEALAAEGFTIERIPVDSAARLQPEALPACDRTALLIAQAANHETGVVQPYRELAAQARAVGAPMLCDAVQAAGKLPLSIEAMGVAAVCVSSHKIYGPSGAGALVLGRGVELHAGPSAGHQERGRRPGTEPAWALAGFGAAAEEAGAMLAAESERQAAVRARLERGLIELGALVFGADAPRVANTSLCAFSGARGQLVTIALDLAGFAISTGAACTSGSVRPSAVLLAAGHAPERAIEALRISIGRDTVDEDVDALLAALPAIVARVRSVAG